LVSREAVKRISELLIPGSSLPVYDARPVGRPAASRNSSCWRT